MHTFGKGPAHPVRASWPHDAHVTSREWAGSLHADNASTWLHASGRRITRGKLPWVCLTASMLQVNVGIGTLAGSTIMLLTVAWGGSLIAGRCDLDDKACPCL